MYIYKCTPPNAHFAIRMLASKWPTPIFPFKHDLVMEYAEVAMHLHTQVIRVHTSRLLAEHLLMIWGFGAFLHIELVILFIRFALP